MQTKSNGYSELKKRALIAKQRLKMGYWQKMYEERERALRENGDGNQERIVRDLQQEKVRRDQNRALIPEQADREELFYCKVCAILDEDENVTNPIGQLIDQSEYDRLDPDNRQRYILQLAEKFREMRERYYRERSGKSG